MCIETKPGSGRLQKAHSASIGGLTCVAGLMAIGQSGAVLAQSAPTALPGIVVQGATLGNYTVKTPRRDADAGTANDDTPSNTGQGNASAQPPPGTASAVAAGAAASTVAGVELGKQGSAVTVITGEELRQQQVRTVADALRSQPGVVVSRTGSAAGLTSVGIRGGVGKDTLVLIDGIEANGLSDGAFDFSNLSTDGIERIEIIKGPQSGIYGSSAASGVINIITKKGQGPLSLTAKAEGGSFNTKEGGVGMSGGTATAWGSIFYNERTSGGFPIAPGGVVSQDSTLKTFSLRAGAEIFKDFTVDLSLRDIQKGGGRAGFGDSGGVFATALDSPSFFASDIWLAGLQGNWSTFGGYWTHKFNVTNNRTRLEDTDISSFGTYFSRNDSDATKASYASTVRLDTPALFQGRQFLTGLVEHADERFRVPSDDESEHTRKRLSTAAEWRGEFAETLFLSATARRDNNDSFDDFTTWRTAASLKILNTGLRLHSSLGTGVKFPSMFQQFGHVPSVFFPNPNLKPEESTGWDAGAEYTFGAGRYTIDTTYFNQNLRNEIRTVFTASFLETVANDPGESRRQGIEVSAKARLTEALTLGTSYTYTDATQSDGMKAIRRPPHSGRVDLNYSFDAKRGNFNVAAAYNGKSEDIAFRNLDFSQARITLGDYVLVTAAASYELQKGVEVFGRVENALNQHYQEVYGYQTAGAAAYAGMRIKLDVLDAKLSPLKD